LFKREEIRLESQHEVIFRFSGNRLYFPRVEDPRKILECGYGTGDWAVAAAEQYEDCEVSYDFSPPVVGRTRLGIPGS
jgi:ubiquinone/menaquinone biosynthesis C-methylase UbiE